MTNTKGSRGQARDIYSVDFTDYLPETLKRDPKMKALATAVTEQMLGVSAGIDNVLIYSRIDSLPEELVDILAYDMHVDWYDYSFPIKVKREVLKSSVKVHKKMGTKYAVEKALGAIYPECKVEEWFEYGGRPYTFRMKITVGGWGLPEGTAVQLIRKMWFYKNLRSHCDCIFYTLNTPSATIRAAPYLVLGGILKVKARPETGLQSNGKETVAASITTAGIIKVKALLDKEISSAIKGLVYARTYGVGSIKVKAQLQTGLQEETREVAAAGTAYTTVVKIKAFIGEKLYCTARKPIVASVKGTENIKVKVMQEKNINSHSKTVSSAGAAVAGMLVVKARSGERGEDD